MGSGVAKSTGGIMFITLCIGMLVGGIYWGCHIFDQNAPGHGQYADPEDGRGKPS